MNMLLILLTLIAIFLFDRTLGKAFDSQRSNKDIFRKDLRGMQRAKEMLSSDQANFSTNPQKSETNNRSAFERFSVPISNGGPASTISSFLSQLMVVPTSSFSHFHVPTNATNTATGLTSLNDVTIAHFSATTATTTATMTQVPATATTNAPKYQLKKCKATQAQLKTMSPSILHPANSTANHVTSRSPFLLYDEDNSEITTTPSLLLPFNQDNSAIMTATHAQNLLLFLVRNDPAITISSLLLPHGFARPAITTAMNGDFSLQLIVESLSTGAHHLVAPATILDDSFKLIDVLASEGAMFAPYIFEDASARTNKSSKFAVASQAMVLSMTIGGKSNGSFKPQKLYSKRSLHFREDCGIFC
jgi:hypothetical protein